MSGDEVKTLVSKHQYSQRGKMTGAGVMKVQQPINGPRAQSEDWSKNNEYKNAAKLMDVM